jgi:hypothetical protein
LEVTLDTDYVQLLVTHQPAKPRNRQELADMTFLLETLAANETPQTPAMERFIETLTALIMQYEEELCPDPERSPAGVLRYLMEERGLRQVVCEPNPVGAPANRQRSGWQCMIGHL